MEGEGAEAPLDEKANQALGGKYIAVEPSEREVILLSDDQESESRSMQSSSSVGDQGNLVHNLGSVTGNNSEFSSNEEYGGIICLFCQTKLGPKFKFCFECGKQVQKGASITSECPVQGTSASDVKKHSSSDEKTRRNVVVVAGELTDPKQVAVLDVKVCPHLKAENNLQQLSPSNIAEDKKDVAHITDIKITETAFIVESLENQSTDPLLETSKSDEKTQCDRANELKPQVLGHRDQVVSQIGLEEALKQLAEAAVETSAVRKKEIKSELLQETSNVQAGMQSLSIENHRHDAGRRQSCEEQNTVDEKQLATKEKLNGEEEKRQKFAGEKQEARDYNPNFRDEKEKVGSAKQNAGDEKPIASDGKPTTGDGKPTTGDGKPTTGDGKPTTDHEKRSADDGKQTTGGGELTTTGDEKQATGDGKQITSDGNQNTGDGKQNTGDGIQATGDRKQTTGDGKQTTGDGKQNTGDEKESIGDGNQSTGDGKQTTGDGDQNTSDGKRSTGDGKQTTGDGNQNTGDGKGSTGDEKQATGGGKQITSDGNQNTGDGKQNTGDGKQATGDREQTTGDGKQTTGDGEQNTGDEKESIGDGNQSTGDGKQTTGDEKQTTGDGKGSTDDGDQNTGGEKQTTGDRKEITGDGKGSAGDGKQTTGDGDQNTSDGKGSTGDGKQTTGDEKQNTGDDKGSTVDEKQNTGDGNQNTGHGQQTTGDGKQNTGIGKGNTDHGKQNIKDNAKGNDVRKPTLRALAEQDPSSTKNSDDDSDNDKQEDDRGHFYRKPDVPPEETGKKKKNKSKGKDKEKPQKSTTPNTPEKVLTVLFHAILSEKFKREEEMKIVIRGEEPVFAGWNKDTVTATMEENTGKQLIVQACINISMKLAFLQPAYKYVLLYKKDKGKATYEEIVEFPSWYGYVNRCLVIPREYDQGTKIFHKYDGFIYPKPSVRGWFSSGSPIMDDRRAFFSVFFPKWKGFHISLSGDEIRPLKGLENLDRLVKDVSVVYTSNSGNRNSNTIDANKLKLGEVFKSILLPKVSENLKALQNPAKDVTAKVNAVFSSLVIAYVFTKYRVELHSEHIEMLLKCLILPSNKEVCSELMKRIKEFDDNVVRSFKETILQFYKKHSSTKFLVHKWLPALPLLHFLREESKPFEDVICNKTVDFGNWKWWGLENFSFRDIRMNIKASDAMAMLPGLKEIFDMDRLLKRTFLLLCPVDIYGDLLKNGCFSCLELCVTLRKLLPDTTTSSSYTKTFVEYLSVLFKEMNGTFEPLSPKEYPKERLSETLLLLDNLVRIVQFVKTYLKLQQVELLCHLGECLVSAIVLQKNGIDLQERTTLEDENEPNENSSTPYQLTERLKEMSPSFQKFFTFVEKFIDGALPVYITVVDWSWELHETPLRKIELFCKSDEQKCHRDIAAYLGEAAFNAVEQVVKDGREELGTFRHLTANTGSTKAIKLLSTMLHKAWPTELKEGNGSNLNDKERDYILVNHLLTWSTWPEFLKFFGSSTSSKEDLTNEGDCGFMMATAESCVLNLINSVEDGTATVSTLQTLQKHSIQFLKLADVHQTNQTGLTKEKTAFKTLFSQRLYEMESFFTMREKLESFIALRTTFTSVDEEIAKLRGKVAEDVDEIPISKLCTRTPARIVVEFFDVDDKFFEMITQCFAIKNSRIFSDLWRRYSKKLREVATLDLIFTNVWQTTCEELKDIKEQFLNGEMKLTTVEGILELFNDDYENLRKDFSLIFSNLNNIATRFGNQTLLNSRIQQVQDYKKLFHAGKAARAILELKMALGLQGDFKEVENINEIIEGKLCSQPIDSIDKKILKAGKLLEDLTPEKTDCLKAFQQCSEMVTWLQENIKDQQELKVFVDLAMISAGEDDMEIDRISCMHTSCLGFGSLIFGLKQDHGFNDLMKLCEPVWQAVLANPTLGEKLKITNRYLSWLRQIKESHGSVAYTTLMQVEAINSCGIYYIGDQEKGKRTKQESDELCLEDLIYLVVPEDNIKQREGKVYTMEEIKDVQSKLMLIAGKAESGKEDVDQFLEVFEGVLRIGELYLQLCEVGDVSYLTWKEKLRSSKLEERREHLLQSIEDTCKKMRNSLMMWKNEINKMRASCYSLNHFTVKQILKLRKELAKACTGQVAVDELPLQTFMLLESVNKNVEPLLLANVLKTTVPENAIFITESGFDDDQEYFTREVEIEEIISEEETDEDDMHFIHPLTKRRRNSLETFNSAKETLEGMDHYREELVVAALQDCGRHATEEELIAWVLSSEKDDETVMKLCEDAKRNPALSDILEHVFGQEYDTVDQDEMGGHNVTVSESEHVSRKDLPKTDKPYVHNEEDTYLTLEALTAILESLYTPESRSVHRKLPSNLKEGEPNLLLVPKGEVFGCVLSLFMGPKNQPLPTDEEVIVCDENTTAEEIELLWRRAVVESGFLFCLANADLLDYDVSQQAVRSLEMLTQGHHKYHLVVICSIENEDKSNMVASLDQYRRQFPPLTSFKGIQKYLKEQFVSSDEKMVGDVQWQPAASVEREDLSVRVVQSSRAGMGKSLIVKHLAENLNNLWNNKKLRKGLVPSLCPTIPVHGISVDSDHVTRTLLKHAVKPNIPVSRIFHLDMSQSVAKGLDNFLFKLVILRAVKDSSGNVWRRKSTDLYIVEITTDKLFATLTAEESLSVGTYSQNTRKKLATNKYSFVKFLPRIHCLTPRETLNNLQQNREGDTGFDMEKFHSEEYQRTFHYLTQFASNSNLDQFLFIYEPRVVFGDPVDALTIFIKYCGIRDPSWAELHHFVNFLNVQLRDCEESVFCDVQLVGDLLQGFRTFAVRFMIQMSRDFATRSLSDNNLGVDDASTPEEEDDLAPFQIRRRWELSPHPYIFFNQDHNSMTFLGFRLSNNGDLLDPGNNRVLEERLMDPTLRGQLKLQGVDFDANYEKRDRMTRIENLCSVMGITWLYDPDSTYELTTDNVEKILAIHMRFRCGIPVIIMGETGCGKTRLIRFMCELQAGPDGPKNMLLMKVHGGTTYAEIEKKVEDAEKLATFNEKINVDTILFFDEANTTDAIDLIKEIMVDRRVNGRAIDPKLTRLHFIAACNPYRKHTKEMIQKLESAGLGYHVSADETEDKLGSIPLRQLVYRVHPLPESMRPLVWDFGQLTDHTEELYTKQIVRRFVKSPTLRNECSFVSLRDVERAMKVITWFYTNSDLITRIIEDEDHTDSSEESSQDESEESAIEQPLNQIVRAVVLGIGVCYYARLNERGVYCRDICRYFDSSCPLPGGTRTMQRIIVRCQRAFLKDIQLGQNIARNTALSENVFMMAICTELRIPLFVVGKPGSSKSLAKDVVSTNMKAAGSHSELFRNLKQIHMQSYQCSPLSTPEGIVSTFRQCAKLQRDKDLKKFVSVVVLDEIGLAEDSPLMPLKTLHPLLEDGTATAEESGVASDHQRVGFIGLSNWALDPAKMNRGIMLSRGSPSERELLDSARGICSGDECVQRRLDHTIWQLCKGYFDLYKKQRESKTLKDAQKDEFFGLRDFYSLVKMVYGFAVQAENGDDITDIELETSIRRNFSGLDDLYPVKIFSRHFRRLKHCLKYPSPECLPVSLIHQSLGRSEDEGESRYLLVLTENYAALRLLQREFLKGTDHDPVVIFGSSFPKDQQYTQICRNINRIKVCMETGRMVILLNLESLYESLYDALNQYYVYLAEQKYVDLGLGNHRVKCRVADKFKLIVVAEKDVVYQRFPIPLINRLEKHLLVMSTGLTERQIYLVKELEEWVKLFSKAKQESSSGQSVFEPGDCFVGYHSDTAAAVVIKMSYLDDKPNERILSESKYTLLQIASPDAIARLPATKLSHYAKEYWTEYFKNQKHGSLKEYLVHCLECKETENEGSLVQITTHSRLLSQANSRTIASAAKFAGSQCRCISLQEFHTEQQFTKTIEEFFVQLGGAEGLLLVQSDSGEANFNLIACCRYLVDERRRRILEDIEKSVKPIHIVFIIQLPKIAGGCQHFVGFQGGKWRSVHIDELLESHEQLPQIEQLINRSVSDLFQKTNIGRSDDVENMDVDKDLDNLPTDNSELHAENTQNLSENEIEHEEIKPTVLLKSCLQAAAARIYDESPELDRATKRIEILLECLPEDNAQETELSTILIARIYQLLQQRDERCFENQRLWLQHEALCQGHLQETGTFRKALWQKLSSIVSPMLSEVIAFCDCNNNLGLLHEAKEWKSKLWFTMLNEAQVTPLSYDSFISPVSGKLRERACVQNTGKGHHFKAKFPFSWIIRNVVSEILLQTRGVYNHDPSKTLVSLRGAFYSSPLGQLLRPMFEDKVVKDEAAMNYLNDFLHMIYKPRVEGELQLICDAVLSAAGRLHQLLYEDDEFDLDIPFIHFAYSFIEPRLANFSELVLAFPEVVKKILEMRQKLDVGEMILDVVALECCIRQLEPSPKELEQRDNRLIWCNRVQSIRPIIEVMKSLILRPQQQQQGHTNNDANFEALLFGEKSGHILQNCRTTWIRIDVVRLFIEHTFPPGQSNHPGGALNAFILWKALGEKPDFSTVHTMTVIEKFLKECSERVSKRLVKFDISQCQVCQNPLQDPVQMPCDHVCCLSCANGWFKDHNACPVCRNEVGDDFKVEISERCRKAIEIYNGFRSRCKSFFMELVSLYCFGEQLPDPDLVIKFIGYVIKDENTTEEFTPFDGQGIDVTPVIRSFILQQLLVIKGREKEVLGHLEEYLRRARGLAEKREHLIEVCVLCVQCMEDVETVKLLKGKVAGKNTQILMASTILERSLRNISISETTFNIEGLKSIAGIRAALDVLATYLGEDFDKNIENFENLPKCLEAARYLCRNEGRSAIQLFLLKQLVRHDQNGIDAVKERCKRQELKWIMPPQSEEQDKTPDTFIDHHGDYHTVREALGKTILTSNTVDLDAVIQNLQAQPFARSCYVLLALFREITTRFSFNKTEDRIPTRVLEKLTQYIARTQHLPNELKQLAGDLLTNFENANSPLLQLYPQQSGNDRRLIEVLIHFRIVMECLPQNRILQPLRNLALNPAMMTNAFIPTMPQDYGLEAMQVNLGRWYECPNGHRYVITECGRPNQAYKCIECGANIGGLNYNLAANNRDTTRQDRSSTGHILGRAQVEQQTVTPERNLTPLACGVLRCLTHAAMLLGTDQNVLAAAAVIKPPVHDVVQFLMEHLQHDVRCIAQITGNNDDEAIQIIHLVLVDIVNNLNPQQGNIDARLPTTDSRTAWEDAFMTTHLNPILSSITNMLQESFGRMVRDERLGNNRLMRLLHEVDSPNYEIITDLMCPALWRYRKKITIEYLSFKFQEYSQGRDTSGRCHVLGEFLKQEHLLRALQYLPDILKLQRLLSEKFYRRLDRNEAEKYTLGNFLKRALGMKGQVNTLVQSFRMAWKILRSSLLQNGRYSISQEMCDLEVKSLTPISMFLPAVSGLGVCASAMTSKLVTLHNNFIGRCKSLLNDKSSSSEIPLTNITKAHLVAYDPEKDLLPMIFAHCDYSLKVGEGTVVEFNWKGLERQLVDRFIRGRPRLMSLVELFVFSKDICDGEVFKALKQKIPQVELSRPVQDQILNELNQLTDVCDVLKSLHIAIGFLSSAGGDPFMSIHNYLHTGLKMAPKDCLKSTKAEQFCQLQHIVSLWLLLSLERARVLTKRKQDPFDDVSENVKSRLDKKQKFNLSGGLQKLNVDYFVRELLEAILLYLKNVPQDQLHFPLSEYINARLEDKACDVIDGLEEHVPGDITVEHAVEAWKVACQKSEDYHSKMLQ